MPALFDTRPVPRYPDNTGFCPFFKKNYHGTIVGAGLSKASLSHMGAVMGSCIDKFSTARKTSLFISLWILRDSPRDPTIFLCSHVPMESFLIGQIMKIQKQKDERDREGKFNKIEEKYGGKKKKRLISTWSFPFSCDLHRLGTASGYRPRVNLPQENPLVCEPPLQHYNQACHIPEG
jgi:hypothetical protein